jgi:hypothetical protein
MEAGEVMEGLRRLKPVKVEQEEYLAVAEVVGVLIGRVVAVPLVGMVA